MKLVRYGVKGAEKPGIVDVTGRIRDLSAVVADINGQVLAHELDKIRALDLETLPLVEEGVRYGACVGNIGKFICIGLNYSDHAAETGAAIPEEPIVFNKWTSAILARMMMWKFRAIRKKPTGKWNWAWSSAKTAATSTKQTQWIMWLVIV